MQSLPNTAKGTVALLGLLRGWLSSILPGIALVIVLVGWELGVYWSGIEKWILPAPTQVFQSLWESREMIWLHSIQTLYETLAGFGIAVLLALVIATTIDYSPWFAKVLYPLLIVSQTIPIIAIAPLFIMWFGYGVLPKIIVVALVCFFPIAINLVAGYQGVDSDMVRMMKAMGASKHQIFRMVKFPAAQPFFFSGLKIAGTYSVMGAVIGEWLGASKGLGVLMVRSSHSFLTERVFATILVITFLSLIITFVIDGIGRGVMPWHYRQDQK